MIDWDKIEKATIYTSLVLISVIEIISATLPNLIPPKIATPIITSLICVVALALFKYISSKFDSADDIDRSTFTKSTNMLLDKVNSKKIKTLDLFVYSGNRYSEIICEKDITKISHVRILFSQSDKSDAYKEELKKQLVRWLSLHKRGIIETLEFRFYSFEPSVYFCIIDNKFLNFGLIKAYRPRHVDMLRNAYIIIRKDIDQLIISDFKEYFSHFFDNSPDDFIDINTLEIPLEIIPTLTPKCKPRRSRKVAV